MEHPTWPCPTCGQDTQIEQPVCVDGHTDDGGECPEWACVECGTAFVGGHLAAVALNAPATWGRAA